MPLAPGPARRPAGLPVPLETTAAAGLLSRPTAVRPGRAAPPDAPPAPPAAHPIARRRLAAAPLAAGAAGWAPAPPRTHPGNPQTSFHRVLLSAVRARWSARSARVIGR